LAASRQHMLEGQYESAAEGFGHLISQGHMVSEVITELEAFTASRPAVAPLYRTLGDAYMRAGKLQRALDAYRAALTQM
jgi:cytochrome c-type biogenesis protein CcmH/NrfG